MQINSYSAGINFVRTYTNDMRIILRVLWHNFEKFFMKTAKQINSQKRQNQQYHFWKYKGDSLTIFFVPEWEEECEKVRVMGQILIWRGSSHKSFMGWIRFLFFEYTMLIAQGPCLLVSPQ